MVGRRGKRRKEEVGIGNLKRSWKKLK